MRFILAVLVFSLSWILPCGAQTIRPVEAKRASHPGSAKIAVELSTVIIEQVSCSPTHLSLALRLVFQNVGREPIILDKRGSTIAFVTSYMVSVSREAAAAKRYEQVWRTEDFGFREVASDRNDPSNFIILTPGERYNVESPQSRVSLPISDGTSSSRDYLALGTHFIQVNVGTLLAPSTALAQLKSRWRNKGYLWSRPLTSEPMPFVVERGRPITQCR